MNANLLIEVVPGYLASSRSGSRCSTASCSTPSPSRALPDRIRRYYHTTLVGLHDAVTEAGGTLEGAFWTVDAQNVDELTKLCEEVGFTVRVL